MYVLANEEGIIGERESLDSLELAQDLLAIVGVETWIYSSLEEYELDRLDNLDN